MLQHVIAAGSGVLNVLSGTGAVTGSASQGVFVTSSDEVEVVIAGTITHYLNGLPFDTNGRLAVSTASAIAHYHNGLPYTAAGEIAVSGNAVDHIQNGLPFDSGGKIAVTGLP